MSGGDHLNKRIKELRKLLGLTQEEFATKIGIKRNTLANYEIGRNIPIDGIVFSICREFNVNEDWLRFGTGDMFKILPEDEIASAVSEVLEDIQCENTLYTLIKEFLINYQKSDQKTKNAIDTYLNNALKGYQKRKEDK